MFSRDTLAKCSFFAGVLLGGCLFLEPSAAISVAPLSLYPNLCPCDYSPYTMLFFSLSPLWELKYHKYCLLFQCFWFQFHIKFYLSVSVCRRCLAPVLRCLGVCDLSRCVVVPVPSMQRSVCVCVPALCVFGSGWLRLCSICKGCLIALYPRGSGLGKVHHIPEALAMTTLHGCFSFPDPWFLQACVWVL